MMEPLELTSPPPPRSPWQRLYGAAHAMRRRWYRRRARRLPVPVISIGNLHWGGTGKTPLVAAVAAHLRDLGLHVAILSRGYGSRGKGVRIVSAGEGPLLGPLLAGDEPVLLAGELPGVAVVVAPDRYQAGRHALERLDPPPQICLLDDGFSHLRLQRDLDILLFPASDPFGGGRLPPSGRLREPLASVARADAAILSPAASGSGGVLTRALRPHGFRGEGFASEVRSGEARLDRHRPLQPGARVLLVSAIARPERFRRAVEELGFEIAESLEFGDHHAYPARSLKRIREIFSASAAELVLTTGKDRVKLHGRLDLPLAELPVHAEPEAAFWRWLELRVTALTGISTQKPEDS